MFLIIKCVSYYFSVFRETSPTDWIAVRVVFSLWNTIYVVWGNFTLPFSFLFNLPPISKQSPISRMNTTLRNKHPTIIRLQLEIQSSI